jgi:indolepyruvate decarboxylase
MNLTESLLHALKARGATEIFGIPGDFALALFREIERSALLPLVTLSHEPGVGFAADAAARMRGGLGVAAVTYGAGAFNLVNAVAGAYAERVPLVVISGAPAAHEADSGYLLHHQVKTLDSQWRLFEELTVDRARLDDLARAPELIARVLDTALTRSRPVYLEIPRDMPSRPCAAVPVTPPFAPDAQRLAACADELLARLAAAQRPVLMVGVEVHRYALESRVAELARRLAIPVVSSFMGRGLLARAEVPLAGTYIGLAGDQAVSALVEQSDGLLLMGVIVSDTNFAVSSRRIDMRSTIQVFDGDVQMGHHVYHELPIAALIDALLARVESPGTPRAAAPAGPATEAAPPRADGSAVTPQDISAAVNALFSQHGPMPLASDMGDCLFAAMDIAQATLVAPGYYATMGYGVPAGIGLQVATGQRPIILVGDGAFQMTGWELGNAARCGCDPIVLVLNNASWEMLRTFEPRAHFNDLPRWDFAAMAAGMGGDGHAVTTTAELAAALAKAHAARGRFQLLDIRIEPGVLSPTLSRFVNAVKRVSMPEAGVANE